MSLGIILGFLICMSKCVVVLDYFVLCVFVFYDDFPTRYGRFTHIRFFYYPFDYFQSKLYWCRNRSVRFYEPVVGI